MRGAVLYGAGEVRFEELAQPSIIKPTDAVITLSATAADAADVKPGGTVAVVGDAVGLLGMPPIGSTKPP
jgi:hypothetical protein